MGGRALWTMLLILCPLVGYSFFQAVALYGEASSAARDSAALASGLSPLDGVLVPSFGAFYLAVTLLFPFVAIRTLGREKDSGGLRLLVQLPYRVSTLIAAKIAAVSAVWLVALVPALSALAIWAMLGGHLHPPETLNLLFGHLLYGLLVGAIALFAAAVSDSAATAAIVALAFTIGSWVLDFALAGQPGVLGWIARLSLTQTLRSFEQGLLALGLVLGSLAAIGGFAALAAVWLHPGVPMRPRIVRSLACAAIVARRSRRGDAGPDNRSMSPRIAATPFRPPISARSPNFASRCSSPFAWRRKIRAMSICGATFSPSSSGRCRMSRSVSPRPAKASSAAPAMRPTARSSTPMAAAPTRAARPALAKSCRCSTRWRKSPFRRRSPARTIPGYPLVADAAPALIWFLGDSPAPDPRGVVGKPPPAANHGHSPTTGG